MVASRSIERARPFFAGWRGGLARCTGATALVALVNILFLSIATPNFKADDRKWTNEDPVSGDGAIFEGSCEKAKQLSVWIHLAINLLSTVLLTSGNYAQQMLTAPTRKEIDRVHAKHSCLDIGVLSYRNLRGIPKRRVLPWAILVMTSIPIHLLYNSAISLETNANLYEINVVRANETSTVPDDFERLENDKCITQYARPFIPNRSDVFLVVSPDVVNPTSYRMFGFPDGSNSYGGWVCPGSGDACDMASLKEHPDDWKIRNRPGTGENTVPLGVKYCLSKPVDESCRLAMSTPLMATVVGCNVLKLVGLGLTWIFLDRQPLLTLGDAVASFLESPDPMSLNSHLLCIGPWHSIKWGMVTVPWRVRRRRWAYFIPPYIYGITMLCSFAVIVTAIWLLKEGIEQIAENERLESGAMEKIYPSLADLWDRGIGSLDLDCVVAISGKSPIRSVLLSNTPQLIVSMIYTTVNGMWTAMMVGNEWNGYGLRRKGLRTTAPVGHQRCTYWLSLPWRYGLPLVAASTLLHWLISQSIYPVRLLILDNNVVTSSENRPGYSPMGVIFSIICGATIIVATVVLSLLPCKTAIPQIGTCSAVVSAACHPPKGDESAALKRVKWGVISEMDLTMEVSVVKERCCVTSLEVEPPMEGRIYR